MRRFLQLFRPYLGGAAAAMLVVTIFYARSTIQFPEVGDIMRERARVNFCQAFAFSFQQRNPDWQGNPFLNCGELMASTFSSGSETGRSGPGFIKALGDNPGEVLDYLRWNATLIPNGIQLALFNGTSRSHNPDYAPIPLNQTLPWLLSITSMLVLLGGAWARLQDRRFWAGWFRERRWPLLALVCPALGAVIVMVQQRPRPSYMFSFTLLLMILIGFCAYTLLRAVGPADLLALACHWLP